MDHGDHTSSPSARKTQLYEKRMEMISRLMIRLDEEANDEQTRQSGDGKNGGLMDRISKSLGLDKWLNVVYRMFT
ncbi:hypothetical protein [Paenibacillus harenae]|uniref:Uncharacterized protein n=1 Tax=Paenibacillus harenae TaxID=306543 RepID=A0ABT9U9N1_PAEHA|nr:hypothetical protein [Paenibacillus harenae]MDQ0063523.1 hypothetical protein [Paenibacillus harenae]MDQ0115718.1 hypothetical protein [Paenibacillus harenae]